MHSEEEHIRAKMAVVSADDKWNTLSACKILLLEHHMAAIRYGFMNIFTPLKEISDWKNSLLDGTHPALSFLSNIAIPFYDAVHNNDEYAIMSLIRKESPLLNRKNIESINEPSVYLSDIAQKVMGIKNKLAASASLSCGSILQAIKGASIFTFPEILDAALPFWKEKRSLASIAEESESFDAKTQAILKMLDTSIDEIRAYHKYVTGESPFDTHHGIKGLEFERVFVVLDDSSARGNWFSYDKVLGAKPKTKSDLENQDSGKETSLDRTMRLLYVTCSRATGSLAIVVYTENPQAVKAHILGLNWFSEEEVDII